MPAERIPMRHVLDVLRLTHEQHRSQREIARSLGPRAEHRLRVPPPIRRERSRVAPAARPRRGGAGGAALRARRGRARGVAPRPRLGRRPAGAQAQGRHPAAPLDRVPAATSRWSPRLPVHAVLPALPRVGGPGRARAPAGPRRRREALRRLRRAHDARHRPGDGRAARGAGLRRRARREPPALRRGDVDAEPHGLDRRARAPARVPGRRPRAPRPRQPQVGRPARVLLRADAPPDVPGLRGALRHRDPAGARSAPARQGEGRDGRADRRARDPRPAPP